MGTGSLIFASPHFLAASYKDSLTTYNDSVISQNNGLCVKSEISEPKCDIEGNQGNYLQNYKYIFILGQLMHGIGAASLITLGNFSYKTDIFTIRA